MKSELKDELEGILEAELGDNQAVLNKEMYENTLSLLQETKDVYRNMQTEKIEQLFTLQSVSVKLEELCLVVHALGLNINTKKYKEYEETDPLEKTFHQPLVKCFKEWTSLLQSSEVLPLFVDKFSLTLA